MESAHGRGGFQEEAPINEPLVAWGKVLLRLGAVLLAVGLLPLLATQYLFTGFDQLIPILLAFSVAPLGGAIVLIALILFLAALLRRRPGSS
jgi:hypothetical protein